jgi:hypothetical protein
MTKQDIIRKLTSRKFWAAVAEFVSMMIVALGGTQDEATKITALILAGAAVVAYIIGEGLADSGRTIINTTTSGYIDSDSPEVITSETIVGGDGDE